MGVVVPTENYLISKFGNMLLNLFSSLTEIRIPQYIVLSKYNVLGALFVRKSMSGDLTQTPPIPSNITHDKRVIFKEMAVGTRHNVIDVVYIVQGEDFKRHTSRHFDIVNVVQLFKVSGTVRNSVSASVPEVFVKEQGTNLTETRNFMYIPFEGVREQSIPL